MQAEAILTRTGHYLAVVYADIAYSGSRANIAWSSERGIRLTGIGPERPPMDLDAECARQRIAQNDEATRHPIEDVFGSGKQQRSINRIMAKFASTAACVIALVHLVMDPEALLTPILLAPLVCWAVDAFISADDSRILTSTQISTSSTRCLPGTGGLPAHN